MTSSREAIPDPAAPSPPAQPLYEEGALELKVRHVMSPGVVTISDDAMVGDAVDAMALHRIHVILVVGGQTGTALGWVTTRGLLGFVGRDARTPVTDAITERVTAIEPSVERALGDLCPLASRGDAAARSPPRAGRGRGGDHRLRPRREDAAPATGA
jgi:CBS domain-containing protein